MIELNFRALSCGKCNSTYQYAIMKGNRYGIYCKDCGKFIKWADKSQTVVINARKAWLDQHDNGGESV